jgi:hypothetical protein
MGLRSLCSRRAFGVTDVGAGQAILTRKGEWIRYATLEDGAEYIAVRARVLSRHGPPR